MDSHAAATWGRGEGNSYKILFPSRIFVDGDVFFRACWKVVRLFSFFFLSFPCLEIKIPKSRKKQTSLVLFIYIYKTRFIICLCALTIFTSARYFATISASVPSVCSLRFAYRVSSPPLAVIPIKTSHHAERSGKVLSIQKSSRMNFLVARINSIKG